MTAKKQLVFESVLIFLVCALIYELAGNQTRVGDTIPNTLFCFNLLQNGLLTFDNFRHTYLGRPDAYWFCESPTGFYNSAYPLGTSCVAFPISIFYWLYLCVTHQNICITSEHFEPLRIAFERIASACIAASSVAVFFLLSRLRFKRSTSLITTLAYAFATSTWTISSQALWQHGAANLCTLVAAFCAALCIDLKQERLKTKLLLLLAGFACALLPQIRPVDAIFSLAILTFSTIVSKKKTLWMLPGLLVVLPGFAYNVFFFHNLLGDYQGFLTNRNFTLSNLPQGFLGCLFSPGRGLFVYSPVFFFSIAALMNLLRERKFWGAYEKLIMLLTCASMISCTVYFGYRIWWGGACYGPRLLTESVPILSYLLNYYLQPLASQASKRPWHRPLFYAFIAVSTLIHSFGVFGKGSPLWNAIPNSVDLSPARLWQISDSPVERSARSCLTRGPLRKLAQSFADDSPPEANVILKGSVEKIIEPVSQNGDLKGNPSSFVPMKLEVRNSGTYKWVGYESGCITLDKLTYVKVSFLNDRGQVESDCGGELPIAGSPGPDERSFAAGPVKFPLTLGKHKIRCHLHCFYVPEKSNDSIDLNSTAIAL